MKHKTTIFSLFLAAATLLTSGSAMGQNIEKPTIQGKTSYAVVVDQTTLEKCRAEIDSYKAVVESEGLPTFIVADNWNSPEEVKNILKDLYKNNNLEGAFFVGDIPVAMVTKAQHLTTAFKLSERENALFDASVPTDRFYDDFDLEFDFIKDSTNGLFFYYQLSPVSPQYIECDIYSARLKPQASNGDKYEQISKYLKKAVAVHKEHNHFDTYVSFTGHGSHSECLQAWRFEQQALLEQYPNTFNKYNTAKFIRYSMDLYTKDYVIRELRRDDLDFMVIHGHGMPERQYLETSPNHIKMDHYELVKYDLRNYMRDTRRNGPEKAEKLAEKWGLDSTWYAGYDTVEMIRKDSTEEARTGILIGDVDAIAPNARFVIMDCCFNGDFRYDDFIAGKYIMTEGKCVAAFANSVNVLQDISTFDLMGLLGQGARLGNWAKYNNILESHIFGDPTFHFHAPHSHAHAGDGHHHSHDINEMMASNSNDFWLHHIDHHNPDVQNVALIKLLANNYKGIEDILLKKVKESPYSIVRCNALKLLEKTNSSQWHEALKVAYNDNLEFTRRIAVNRMGACGNPEFIPYLIDAFVNDYAAIRVKFNLTQSLRCFDKELVLAEVEKYFADKSFYLAETFKEEIIKIVNGDYAGDSIGTIKNKESKMRNRISSVLFLRNVQYHQIVDELLSIIRDKDEDTELKQYIVESLAWFRKSKENEKIVSVFEQMLAEKEFATPGMERELVQACSRLKSVK